MTVDEIIAKCHQQQGLVGEDAFITLLMPGKWGKRDTRRLYPGGPAGRIVADHSAVTGRFTNQVVVMFRAKEVLKALEGKKK